MPKFVPTGQERRCVAIMSGMGVPTALIRAAIGGRGKTGALSKTALWKHFRKELECGAGEWHGLVASKFRLAIEAEKPWAILAALRNLPGYRWDQYGKVTSPAFANDGDDPQIKVEFVYPDPPKAIDVTPPQPAGYAADAKPDYSVPAIEPPRPRVQTDSGAVYEVPREHRTGPSYESQVGEPPPSIFDRGGGPRGWMK
jgi:hypothetical protein